MSLPTDDQIAAAAIAGILDDAGPPTADDKQDDAVTDDEKTGKKSAATILVEIAEELYEFGISDSDETYAVPRSGPKVVLMLRGGKTSLRGQLARLYRQRKGKVAGQQALADALVTLDGFAQEAQPQRLWQRVANHDDALWLDLGDATGRAVRIASTGWIVRDRPPVLFRRTALTGPLPEPVAGGNLAELWKWLNVAEADRAMLLAYLVAALHPDIPHPILGLFGEQGTGKTTAMKVLVLLLDPGPVPYRKAPKDAESWVTAASGSWMVGLDNLTSVPDWLSDSLCRAVTGDGDVRRKLYTDGELATFAFRRVIAMTGIDLGALNGDLAERLLAIELELISEADRLDEQELWPGWRQAHPRLLGAILNLVAGVAGVLPSVQLGRKPRMADFGRLLAAVDRVVGSAGLDRYMGAQGRMAADSLTGDPFIVMVAETIGEAFDGTAAELLRLVTPGEEQWRAPKGWPTTSRGVTQRLRRQAPVMRKAGWTVDHDDGRNKAGVLRWLIMSPTSLEQGGKVPLPDPPAGDNPPAAGDNPPLAGQAGQAGVDSDLPTTSTGPACAGCGQPLLLVIPGRDTCERCRIEALERG
jgi:hypothetical protein